MTSRILIGAIVLGGLLSGCKSSSDPQPTTSQPPASSINVTISEAGAPSYALRSARVVDANYRTGSPSMSITGTLNNGQVLVLNFTKSGNAAAYTTNTLTGQLGGVAGTAATGTTAYDTQTQMVDGAFQITFPGVGVVNGSFAGIAL